MVPAVYQTRSPARGSVRLAVTGAVTLVAGDIADTAVTLTATQTVSGKTLTTPRMNIIHDTSGDEILELERTGTPVAHVVINNASNDPIIYVKSDLADANLSILPKGTGHVRIGDSLAKLVRVDTSGMTGSTSYTFAYTNTVNRTGTFPDPVMITLPKGQTNC